MFEDVGQVFEDVGWVDRCLRMLDRCLRMLDRCLRMLDRCLRGIFFFSGLFFLFWERGFWERGFWERGFLGLFFFLGEGRLGEGILDYFFSGRGDVLFGIFGIIFFFWERGCFVWEF